MFGDEAIRLAGEFARHRDPQVLDQAINEHRRLLGELTPGTRSYRLIGGELGRHLQYRHQLVGDPAAHAEGLALMLDTVGEPDGALLGTELLCSLASAASAVVIRTGDLDLVGTVAAALTRAIGAGRQQEPRLLDSLVTMCRLRGQLDESEAGKAFLRNGLAVAEQVARLTAHGHQDRPGRIAEVSRLKLLLHRRTGDRDLLDDAVESARLAVDLAQQGNDQRLVCLSQLREALTVRFQVDRDPLWLSQAIVVAESVVAETPEHSDDRTAAVGNLTTQLILLALLSNDLKPARRARDLLAAELDRMAPEDVRRAGVATALVQSIMTIARLRHDRGAHDEAVATLDREYRKAPPNSIGRRMMAQVLAAAMFEGYEREPDPAVLDRIIELDLDAMAAAPAEDHSWLAAAHGAVRHIYTRYQRDKNEADRLACVDIGERLARADSAPPSDRLQGVTGWAAALKAGGDRAGALKAIWYGIELLPLLAWRGSGRAAQERNLRSQRGFVGYAAAVAIEGGEARQAVELLEHGRGVLLNQTLEGRSDLTELRAADPELVDRLDILRTELAQDSVDADRRQRLARDWYGMLAKARSLKDFEDFLRPPRFAELAKVGDAGPVVLVQVHDEHGAAVIVHEGEARILTLPGLTAATLADWVARCAEAVGTRAPKDSALRTAAEVELACVLAELWQAIVEPVLTELEYRAPHHDGEPWPRVWWCPASALSLLPIHAAAPGPGDGALDRVVSSYLPNLGTLSRARAPRPATPRSALAVGVPGEPPLRWVFDEATAVHNVVGGELLLGADATVKEVSAALERHSWVHFACHGAQSPEQPSSGRLMLADGALSVLDIDRMSLPHAEFAYLSACRTALGGHTLPDEAIHLAGALQLAGFRHVIGTLWTIEDDEAAELAKAVYPRIDSGVAQALHDATLLRRAGHEDEPTLWASAVHFGP